MPMQEELLALIEADPGVIGAAGRPDPCAWGLAPEGTDLPRIVLTVVSENRDLVEAGPETLVRFRVQSDIWAETKLAAVTVARAVRAAIDGHVGGAFRLIRLETARDASDTASPAPIHGVSQDWIIYYQE